MDAGALPGTSHTTVALCIRNTDKRQVGVHGNSRGCETMPLEKQTRLVNVLGRTGKIVRMSMQAPAYCTLRVNPPSMPRTPFPATLFLWERHCSAPHFKGYTILSISFLTESPPMHEGYGLLLRGYYVPSVYIYDLIYNLVPLGGQMWETGNSCVLFIEFLQTSSTVPGTQ